ncbi:major facilitator superfamily domain-containing protein [Phascolomyces articulosus]|uniref:Major facilitator superfamily domain-containing protein n=1 Tax=Phascolomyces articulosus TaxID=60185 RepID=A0AAD5PGJ5_9FUNG|nr:major facilitator superfamily domain-containing protein [Phascolomyces articulosus]
MSKPQEMCNTKEPISSNYNRSSTKIKYFHITNYVKKERCSTELHSPDTDDDVALDNPGPMVSEINDNQVSSHVINNKGDERISQSKKCLVFVIAIFSQILNQSSANGLYPALPVIQDDLNTAVTIANAVVALQALMIGLLSSVWATYADDSGRRRVFIASNTFAVLGNIGSALSINIGMLLGFRVICSIGSAASNALGVGMINDVFRDHEKGKALSWFDAVSSYRMAISGFTHYTMGVSFAWAYSTQYQFTTTMVGLFYLAGLPGSTIGTYLGGMISDRVYMSRVERANKIGNQIYPEMRLDLPGLLVAVASLLTSFVVHICLFWA